MSAKGDTLKRLYGAPKPRRFVVVDIEARAWTNPYAVGVFNGHSYVQFDGEGKCIREALDHLLTAQFSGCWIYAHNGGNYDFLFFVRAMLTPEFRGKFRVELTPAGSTIIRVDVEELRSGRHKPKCHNLACPGCGGKRDAKRVSKWCFLDSAKLMPLPLADLGAAFQITRKIKLEMSYDDLAKPENHETMSHYLETDCRSLFQAITVMQERINGLGGQVEVTLPATSLDLFRRKFQLADIHTNRHWMICPEHGKNRKKHEVSECIRESEAESSCLHEFVRRSYFGGPAQIFRMKFVGKAAIEADDAAIASGDARVLTDNDRLLYDPRYPVAKMWDINSHYPAMMLEPMPIGEAVELQGIPESAVYSNAQQLVGIVECDVDIPRGTYLPPLPVEYGKKLTFPTGRLHGTWDAAELALLPEVGGKIIKTYRSVWYAQQKLFTDFILEVYKYRDKSRSDWNKAMDWIAKILMNSAYGKYAMRVLRTRILLRPEMKIGMSPIDFDSDIWSEEVMVAPDYVVPQLAIHIVALARAKLWRLNTKTVDGGGRLYYNDTDSLVTAGQDFEVTTGLGGLKCEATITRAAFVLPKLYLIETEEENDKKQRERKLRIKSKGMGPGIRLGQVGDDPLDRQLSEEEFRSVTMHGGKVTRHRITKLAEGLRDFAKNHMDFPRVIESTKSIKSSYDKRVVKDDFDTQALYLEQW